MAIAKRVNQTVPPIRAAALLLPNGLIVTGRSHFEAYESAVLQGILPATDSPEFWDKLSGVRDGFVDGSGTFLDNVAAAKRAVVQGQAPDNVVILQSESIYTDDIHFARPSRD